jgi:hypothetical protein
MKYILILVMVLSPLHAARSQGPTVAIVPGWGLDTTDTNRDDPQRSAVHGAWLVWRDYLQARIRGEGRADLWVPDERARWPEYDLTGFQAYQSFARATVTVLSILPPTPESADTLVIRTLFTRVVRDSANDVRGIKPISLTRVYAVRTPAGWRLSNAFSRLTSGWSTVQEGPIRFLYSPTTKPSADRRRAARQFADSLAGAHQLPSPAGLLYVVTASGEEAYQAMGFDFAVVGSFAAGKAFPSNRIIVSGDPALGEAYFHELAHMVFEPIAPVGSVPWLVSEGLAVWAGGGFDQTYAEARMTYAAALKSRDDVTLDMVVDGRAADVGDVRVGGAVLCELLFEHGGVQGLRTFLAQASSNLRSAAEAATKRAWTEIAAEWRRRIEH